jgi:hypothetical protein
MLFRVPNFPRSKRSGGIDRSPRQHRVFLGGGCYVERGLGAKSEFISHQRQGPVILKDRGNTMFERCRPIMETHLIYTGISNLCSYIYGLCSIRVGELLQPLDSPLRPRTVKSFRASHNAVVYMLLVASLLYVASAHPMKHESEVTVRVLRNISRQMHDCPYI